MCVEVGPVRVDEARDRLQTKTTLQHDFLLGNLYCHKERVLFLGRQFII